MAPGARRGCTTCYAKHSRCDIEKPVCGNCKKTGHECSWGNKFKFQHESNPSLANRRTGEYNEFPLDQTWHALPQKIAFIDETVNLKLSYSWGFNEDFPTLPPDQIDCSSSPLNPSPPKDHPQMRNLPASSLALRSHLNAYPYESPCKLICSCLVAKPSILEYSRQSRSSSASQIALSCGECVGTLVDGVGYLDTSSNEDTDIGMKQTASVLQDRFQAYLMRHFIDELAPWFDLCDTNRHFARIAPRRALTDSTLLNSICAVSARHLNRKRGSDEYIADDYYQSCLETLIPALDNPTALQDEALFAATVILRLYEELNVSLDRSDPEGHLIGAQVLLNAQKYTEMSSGLRQGAFWVALRQEINIAVTSKRTIKVDLEKCNLDLSFSPASDGTWAHRIIINCAAVVQFCYSKETQSADKWEELVRYNLDWMRYKPRSFEPLYRDDDTGSNVPAIVYMEDAQVLAAQHHTLAKILLTAHNPRHSQLGLDMRFVQLSSEEIKHHVYESIGVAQGNPKMVVALFTCCITIISCITHFNDRDEQQLLLSVLEKAESEHGWTMRGMQVLKNTWGVERLT